jgi:hypothetical protein
MLTAAENPIFIVACPRSGTTILATLLNMHPEICSSTETHFFNFIVKQKKYNWKSFDLIQFEAFLKESRIVDFCSLAKISKEDLIEEFKKLNFGSNSNANKKKILDILINSLTNKKSKKYFCEKTPQHLYSVKEILSLYPAAKFIYLVRDGRDVVNSLMKMPWRPDGLINNSRFWKSYIQLGQKLEASMPESSFFTVRYEDLLNNPEGTLKIIFEYLGIEYSPQILSRTEGTGSENIFSDWETSWKHKSLDEIDSTRVGAWLKELTVEDQLVLNWHQHKLLTKLGYEVPESTLGFQLKFKISVEYLQLGLRKISRLISFVFN